MIFIHLCFFHFVDLRFRNITSIISYFPTANVNFFPFLRKDNIKKNPAPQDSPPAAGCISNIFISPSPQSLRDEAYIARRRNIVLWYMRILSGAFMS